MNIELIIFDMDGVLVDACDWHRIALNEALKQIYNYEISIEDHYMEFNGLPTKVKLKKLFDKGIIENSNFDLVEKIKQEKTIELINKNCSIRQEKINLMNFLKEKNIKIACYTNSIRKTAELMLEKIGVLSYLDLLITNQEVNNSKPDPEGYLLTLKKLNVKKENAIIVEDSPKGIAAAKASGCKVLEVESEKYVVIDLFKGLI